MGLGFSPDRSEVLHTSVSIDGTPARGGGATAVMLTLAALTPPCPFHPGKVPTTLVNNTLTPITSLLGREDTHYSLIISHMTERLCSALHGEESSRVWPFHV